MLSVEFIVAMAVPKVGGADFAAVCSGQAGIDGKYIRSWQRTFWKFRYSIPNPRWFHGLPRWLSNYFY